MVEIIQTRAVVNVIKLFWDEVPKTYFWGNGSPIKIK